MTQIPEMGDVTGPNDGEQVGVGLALLGLPSQRSVLHDPGNLLLQRLRISESDKRAGGREWKEELPLGKTKYSRPRKGSRWILSIKVDTPARGYVV
ncbi:hypothetical protein V1478_011112 [Vespula squamosa]|uniref:Integrase n=1 Tax=Vespula squamosa TaxID=30214 RepID=A0ABD2AIK4_VESSQ